MKIKLHFCNDDDSMILLYFLCFLLCWLKSDLCRVQLMTQIILITVINSIWIFSLTRSISFYKALALLNSECHSIPLPCIAFQLTLSLSLSFPWWFLSFKYIDYELVVFSFFRSFLSFTLLLFHSYFTLILHIILDAKVNIQKNVMKLISSVHKATNTD